MNRISSFTPRFLSASEYIGSIYEPGDQAAVLVRNRIQHQTTQRILPAENIAAAPFQAWLQEQNFSGADIFIGMNPVKEGSRNRTKEQIREIRHAYLDLDEEAGASLQAIRTSGDVPPPNFILDTSPGKHQVVWRVEGLDTNQAETLLRALASQYGGDPAATDISRLLRLPGFTNRKYNEAFVVRVQQETDEVYHIQDFHVQEGNPESPRHLEDSQQGGRRIPAGHRSQSEADWAYARRALARGDAPEAVIRRIADYRAEDKADPGYYARLTVTKAQRTLMSPERDITPRQDFFHLSDRDH
jgi:RepB DNA-primase from phage plasmid